MTSGGQWEDEDINPIPSEQELSDLVAALETVSRDGSLENIKRAYGLSYLFAEEYGETYPPLLNPNYGYRGEDRILEIEVMGLGGMIFPKETRIFVMYHAEGASGERETFTIALTKQHRSLTQYLFGAENDYRVEPGAQKGDHKEKILESWA